jgi:hypothetical protein
MISEVLVGVGLIATAVGSMIYQAHLVKKSSPASKLENCRNTENSNGHHLNACWLLG